MQHQPRVPFAPPSPLFALDFSPNSSSTHLMRVHTATLLNSPLSAIQRLPVGIAGLLNCAAIHCCRISEILELTPAQYIGENRFVVRALKGSRNYIVVLPIIILNPAWQSHPKRFTPFIEYSYAQVWRYCRRAGVGFVPAGHRNVAVTHAHRYRTASAVQQVFDDSAAGDVLHHRSRRSIQYYLQTVGGCHG